MIGYGENFSKDQRYFAFLHSKIAWTSWILYCTRHKWLALKLKNKSKKITRRNSFVRFSIKFEGRHGRVGKSAILVGTVTDFASVRNGVTPFKSPDKALFLPRIKRNLRIYLI